MGITPRCSSIFRVLSLKWRAGAPGRVLLGVFALLATVLLHPHWAAPARAPLRVAIYVGAGTCADKVAALFRAVAAAGHRPLGILPADIEGGRLTIDRFDVFVLPAGEGGSPEGYASPEGLGEAGTLEKVRVFVSSGGGFLGIEAGAAFAAGPAREDVEVAGPGRPPRAELSAPIPLYAGLALSASRYVPASRPEGIESYSIRDSAFGVGEQAAYTSEGAGHFVLRPKAFPVAVDPSGEPALLRDTYGAGRVVLCAFDPELRADSELDWTIWDNWEAGGVHPGSEGAWVLLGRMLNWCGTGEASAPAILSSNRSGVRVAVISTHEQDGGASPSLLPAFARAIEAAGHVPLAVRFEEVRGGRLTLDNFRVVAFPGGYTVAYLRGFAGHEEAIRAFVRSGGGYYGVCAGAYYAAASVVWQGTRFEYPLALFGGTDSGPLDEIAPWPGYALTSVRIDDPSLGDLGVQQHMYYGGGWKSAEAGVSVAARYEAPGPHHGRADAVRFAYGEGRVLLVGTHPEARAGSSEDWLFWDDWAYGSGVPVTSPDNPWLFVDAAFNRWLVR